MKYHILQLSIVIYSDLFKVMMRNLSSVMSATRLSTCSASDRPCTASLLESGCAQPASPLWPDVAPAQGNCSPHTK